MVASLLTEAWRIYRERFGMILAVVTVVWLPCELLSSYLDVHVFQENAVHSFKFSQFLENSIGIIASAAVIFIAITSRPEHSLTFGQSMSAGINAWGRLWWTRLLSGIAVILGLLLLIVPGVYVGVRLCFVENVAVSERLSGTKAIWRSVELTEDRFWPTFRFALTVLLCVLVPIFTIGMTQALIPALNHWLIEAICSFGCDVIAAFATVAYVCGYKRFSGDLSPDRIDP